MLLRLTVVLLACSAVNALNPPPKNAEEESHYGHANVVYFNAFPADPEARPTKYYSHLIGAHPDFAQDAFSHAHTPGNGPYYRANIEGGNAAIVATRVAGDSRLGQRWNLRQRGSNWDASLLWKIDRAGHRLLDLDIWPAGSQPVQVESMSAVLARFESRAAGGGGCCIIM
ncbi:Conserved hypothetical Ustilaginaceae-specific protein [Pseudozyma hubeiensis]|nr:Conserved hypothetical Ustilaginaceae-specific protein [Pseudozyma hubeiensis]